MPKSPSENDIYRAGYNLDRANSVFRERWAREDVITFDATAHHSVARLPMPTPNLGAGHAAAAALPKPKRPIPFGGNGLTVVELFPAQHVLQWTRTRRPATAIIGSADGPASGDAQVLHRLTARQ